MDAATMKKLKADLECGTAEAIATFEEATGLRITCVTVHRNELYGESFHGKPEEVTVSVTAEV